MCQLTKGKPGRAPLIPIVTTRPNELVCIDVVGPLAPTKDGNNYVVTIHDHFTKWTEAIPVPNHTADVVATVFVEQYVTRYGVPESLLSDQGAEFESAAFQSLCKVIGIRKKRTTAHHPSTNGSLERFHRTMKALLQSHAELHGDNWDKTLPLCMFAYRSSVHDTTGYEPFEMTFGRPMNIGLGLQMNTRSGGIHHPQEHVNELDWNLWHIYHEAREMNRKAREANQEQYNTRATKQPVYSKGDLVYLHDLAVPKGAPAKFHRPWTGPFEVVAMADAVNVRIKARGNRGKVRQGGWAPYEGRHKQAAVDPRGSRGM